MYSKEAESYVMGKGVNEGRIVLHSDLNNFFASVECLKHRELSAYPVAVCGSSEQRHGIVLAKNNIAKKEPKLTIISKLISFNISKLKSFLNINK